MATLKIQEDLKKEIEHIDGVIQKEKSGAIAIETFAKGELLSSLDRLRERQKMIETITKQGLLASGELTLDEIGGIMGITRERVRQIEQAAVKKIKHPKLGGVLKKYIDL